MNLITLLINRDNARKKILEYFGYEEFWRIFPIINLTDVYWAYDGPHIIYYNEPLTSDIINEGRHVEASYYWSDESINQYKYERDDFTLFVLKSHIDIMPTLSIFDNSRFMNLHEGVVV